MTEIQRAEPTPIGPELARTIGELKRAAKARNTRRAYRAGWRKFAAWCQASKVRALPAQPAVVAAYLAAQAGRLKPATLGVHMAAVGNAHRLAKHPNPTRSVEVETIMDGIRRTYEVTPTRKDPLLTGDVKAIAARRPDDLRGHRDRAIVLTGFCAGRRRVELENLVVEDLAFCADGVLVRVRKSKTDQVGAGHEVGLGYAEQETACPVTALRRWLSVSGITTGPLFRAIDRHGRLRARGLSGKAIAKIVKRLGAELGLDPKKLGGHSLRRGFVTSADAANVPERDIMQVTAHRSRSGIEPDFARRKAFAIGIVRKLGM